jgi:hypothetical protein
MSLFSYKSGRRANRSYPERARAKKKKKKKKRKEKKSLKLFSIYVIGFSSHSSRMCSQKQSCWRGSTLAIRRLETGQDESAFSIGRHNAATPCMRKPPRPATLALTKLFRRTAHKDLVGHATCGEGTCERATA